MKCSIMIKNCGSENQESKEKLRNDTMQVDRKTRLYQREATPADRKRGNCLLRG